jgi:uncharacterized membrane protein
MHKEIGFRRLVTFSDAVAAIAITLLVLPLVDSANDIGKTSVHQFLHDNRSALLSFALSFLVIGSFWWGQHQVLRGVKTYNPVLVVSMFGWLLAIVFLPFPTELLGSAHTGITTVHDIYIGTMLVAAVAILVQQWDIIHWPELQLDPDGTVLSYDGAVILTVSMALALAVTLAVPSFGLWSLLFLAPGRLLESLARRWRAGRTGSSTLGQAPN